MTSDQRQHLQTRVATASSEELMVMLYDGAIGFVSQARQAMAGGDRERKHEATGRALAIITHLSETLDHDAGWEQSQELGNLYGYMARELTGARQGDDMKPLETVETMLTGLHSTWLEAIENVKRERVLAV